jgi:hypothetical protein
VKELLMMAQPLSYDMGNAGDLLKHGVLAEFIQWWCPLHARRMRFVGPFGGRPELLVTPMAAALRDKLEQYAERLTGVLGVPVRLSAGI